MSANSAQNDVTSNSRLWDIAAASPLVIWSMFALAGFAIRIHGQWLEPGPPKLLLMISEASSAIFLALQAILVCIRRLPLAKAKGSAPRLWAILGANYTYLLLLLPKTPPAPPFALLSTLLVLAGTAAATWVLLTLGKGFAILPQARQLVTSGPYRLVRHPLYVAEQIAVLGLCLQFQQPWAMLIALTGFTVQFPRMHYEENILAATFPAYRQYAEHTARLLPLFY